MIDAVTLIDLIQKSEQTMTVMTPATDYYARRGDTDETSITFVDSRQLIEAIHELLEQ
jgi:hypothetical protein